MEERFSRSDLEKINDEISEYPIGRCEKFAGNNYSYRDVDLDFVVDFLNGIKCDKYIFSGTEPIDAMFESKRFEKLTYKDNYKFRNDCSSVIDNGGQVVNINMNRFEIISKHKRLDLNLKNGIYVQQDNISMKQITPDGLYSFRLLGYGRPSGEIEYRYDLEFIPVKPGHEEELLTTNLAERLWGYFSDGKNKVASYVPLSLSEEDLPKLANKIYRNGLPSLRETLVNGGKLELTEEDRKYYELTDEEKEMIQSIRTSMSNEENIELESNENDTLSTTSIKKDNDVIEKLIALRDMGIELSSEQCAMINLYERLNSEKFQQYKDNSKTRKERQKEIRDEIALENERKEMWQNSPENPTNKRVEELKHMKKQIEGLEALRNIDDSLLSDKQRELIEKGNIFFEMMEEAQSEEHLVDTGMSPEIRDWYQQHYAYEESKSRK